MCMLAFCFGLRETCLRCRGRVGFGRATLRRLLLPIASVNGALSRRFRRRAYIPPALPRHVVILLKRRSLVEGGEILVRRIVFFCLV